MEELADYFALLRRWNQAIRLVGSPTGEALRLHAEDAAALLEHLPRQARVVDVGSGSGFPAIPLAIWRRDLDLVLLEPSAKKHAFLRACRRELRLTNVEALRSRDDDHINAAEFRPFDVAISQATFDPLVWLERGLELVLPGGAVVAMFGHRPEHPPAGVTVIDVSSGGRPRAIGIARRST